MENIGYPSILAQIAQSFIGTTDQKVIDGFRGAVNPKPSGESWCLDFVWYCLLQVVRKAPEVRIPVPRCELVSHFWDGSPFSLRSHKPQIGSIACWEHRGTILGHCGIVVETTSSPTFFTVEGNTTSSEDPKAPHGVYQKSRILYAEPTGSPGELILLGFVNPFG